MKKILFLALFALCVSGVSYADVLKGTIEQTDVKAHKITVNGNIVDVSKATVFTDNDMQITKVIIMRDLRDHLREQAVCYGSVNKDGVFEAYKVKVLEGHR
jgi:hypothetical protein